MAQPGKFTKLTPIDTRYVLASHQLVGYQVSQPFEVIATAYDACPICTGKTDGITKIGVKARPHHTIAVDPNVIPLGSKVYIPSLGRVFTAEDIGGKIKGKRVDIFMESHRLAKQFGVQKLTVFVMEPPTSL